MGPKAHKTYIIQVFRKKILFILSFLVQSCLVKATLQSKNQKDLSGDGILFLKYFDGELVKGGGQGLGPRSGTSHGVTRSCLIICWNPSGMALFRSGLDTTSVSLESCFNSQTAKSLILSMEQSKRLRNLYHNWDSY